MAVVKYQTKMYTPRIGVCSTWLASLTNPVQPVDVWISKGTIAFPKDNNIPVIMVGPGKTKNYQLFFVFVFLCIKSVLKDF